MGSTGTGILFVNRSNQVLLFLRDNIPTIPFPNRWDILGGHLEPGETPEQGAIREIKEEIGLDILHPQFFQIFRHDNLTHYVFWEQADFEISAITLTEGQRLRWFSEQEINEMPDAELAFGFKEVVLNFFKARPFAR